MSRKGVGQKTRTTNSWLFVLLEVIIDEAEYKRRLHQVNNNRMRQPNDSTGMGCARMGVEREGGRGAE